MDNIWKKNARLLFIVLLDIFIISGATYAATTMYASNMVSYDNTTSGLNSTNVQGAMDELYGVATNYTDVIARLSALENNFLDKVYPVGSIYLSTSLSTTSEVASAIGGTWEVYGSGRTLVGVGNNGTSTYAINTTGGSSSTQYTPAGTVGDTTLTTDQIPSHAHNYVKATGVGDHTLTIAEMPKHSHRQAIVSTGSKAADGASWYQSVRWDLASWAENTFETGGDQPHNHPLSTSTVASGATGGGGSHTHSFTGTQATIATQDPYITVYMYKRIS